MEMGINLKDIKLKNYDAGLVVLKEGKEEYRIGPTAGKNEEVIGGWAEIILEDERKRFTKVSINERKVNKSQNYNWLVRTALERAIHEVAIENLNDLMEYLKKYY